MKKINKNADKFMLYTHYIRANRIPDSKEAFAAWNELTNVIYRQFDEAGKAQYIRFAWNTRFC